MQGDSSLCLARTRGDRTSNLLVTSQPSLPPEPHAAHTEPFTNQRPLKVGQSERFRYSGISTFGVQANV